MNPQSKFHTRRTLLRIMNDRYTSSDRQQEAEDLYAQLGCGACDTTTIARFINNYHSPQPDVKGNISPSLGEGRCSRVFSDSLRFEGTDETSEKLSGGTLLKRIRGLGQ